MLVHLLLYLMVSLALNCSWTKALCLVKESSHKKNRLLQNQAHIIKQSNKDTGFQLAIVKLLSTQIFLRLVISFHILLTIFSCDPNLFLTPVTPKAYSIFLHASNWKDILCVRSEALNTEWSSWWSCILRRNL